MRHQAPNKMAYSLTNTITINAPIHIVWEILTNFPRYAKWNSFTPHAECTGKVGDPVSLRVQLGQRSKLMTVSLELKTFDTESKLCWGNDRWYLPVLRCQTLENIAPNTTRYTNSESFGGILSPIVILTQKKDLMRGYQLAAEGLKNYAEKKKGAV